jgi:NADH dehydrogenase
MISVPTNQKHIVIIGGGFAGLTAAKRLLAEGLSDVKISIIDQRNHHLFQPLLYQVATAGLSPAEIAVPIRSLFGKSEKNISVIMQRVESIDLQNKTVRTSDTSIAFDYLIYACGVRHSYFGQDRWEEDAPGLKTLEQATEIRRRILQAFEDAEICTNADEQKKHLTFVIIGGGPTGVELAGALGEISRFTLSRDFRKIDSRRTRILLIEAGPRILPSMDPKLSARAARDLEELGVTVWTSTRVTNINSDGVQLGGESVRASTVLWAAGVQPPPLNQKLGATLDPRGRVLVDEHLRMKGFDFAFAAGDTAFVESHSPEIPGIAPAAIQQGDYVARVVAAMIRGTSAPSPFKYWDKGQMATIGRTRAVAQVGPLKMSGFLAYLMWVVIHIYFLIGFKNKTFVLMQWTWSYFCYRRGARLIVNKEWRQRLDR